MGSFSYKAWYAANAERISAARKARYQNDEAYRQKVLERNKAARTADPLPSDLVSIGALSTKTGLTPAQLRRLEKRGIIPVPSTLSRGRRYYSKDEVDSISEIVAGLEK